MISLITDNKQAIADLCREYRIKRLDLFGSAATGTFDPETSDIDFVVDLGGYDAGVAWGCLDFIEALENLLGYRVEMITEPSIQNPYLRKAIDEQPIRVFEAGDRQAAA